MKQEVPADDVVQAVEEAMACDHMCNGNCRRVGCNCDCGGEFHIIGD